LKHSFGSDWQDLEVWYRKAGRNLYYDDFDPNFQRDVLDNLIDYVKNPRHPYPKEKKLSVWQKKYALNSREYNWTGKQLNVKQKALRYINRVMDSYIQDEARTKLVRLIQQGKIQDALRFLDRIDGTSFINYEVADNLREILTNFKPKITDNLGEAFSEKQLVKMAVDGKQPPKSWWDKMYNKILKSQKRKSRRKEGKYSLKANRHPELIKAKARQITGFQWHVNMVLKKNPKTGKPYFK